MNTRILLSFCLVALFTSCSSTGKVTDGAKDEKLIFGSGGGFTGIYTTYELHKDRNVYALLPDSTLQPIKKLLRKQTRNIFTQADKLKLAQPACNHPGNMTSFIKYETDGVLTEYKWGDPNVSVPSEIKDLYSQLNSIVK